MMKELINPPTLKVHAESLSARVDLWYPREPHHVSQLRVGLIDVRAADDIQISYDYERDGWVVKQASRFVWESGDPVCDPDWQEVAFVKAWGREDLEWEKKITGIDPVTGEALP